MKNSTQLSPNEKNFFRAILILLFLGFLSGCFYYKVTEHDRLTPQNLDELNAKNKYFILHQGDFAWQLNDLKIENDILTGFASPLTDDKIRQLSLVDSNVSKRYYKNKKKNNSAIVNDVHLYVDDMSVSSDVARIPLENITKMEIFDKNRGATTASWVAGTIGITAALAVMIAIISEGEEEEPTPPPSDGEYTSCPFVYSFDGENYSFTGEIYSGAVFPSLERHDYLFIPNLQGVENNYYIYLCNQAKEIQNTNLAELLVFDHPKNTRVFIDKYGNPYFASDIRQPLSAVNAKGESQLPKVMHTDQLCYCPLPESDNDELMDELTVSFRVPENCREGKLILRARNNLLLDDSFADYFQMFGQKLPKWQNKFNQKPAEELQKWSMEQGIPLSVYLEENGTWRFVDYFQPPGPMAFRDDILTLHLSDPEHQEIRIKLVAGQLFWEIDQVSLDFSSPSAVSYSVIKPFRATDQNSTDVLGNILYDDHSYLNQPLIGDETKLIFQVPEQREGVERSVFLHSKGHYTILGNPDRGRSLVYLYKFSKPERFTRLARDHYFEQLEATTKY
ncbi:hypothetical protein [Gaoshiqia sp. Z1-71]|uniref:hypothetical protein n=1 Tax=Gaoshiqia hydrogeniformans TaxID=3290090 RepID=UPI003BF83DE0